MYNSEKNKYHYKPYYGVFHRVSWSHLWNRTNYPICPWFSNIQFWEHYRWFFVSQYLSDETNSKFRTKINVRICSILPNTLAASALFWLMACTIGKLNFPSVISSQKISFSVHWMQINRKKTFRFCLKKCWQKFCFYLTHQITIIVLRLHIIPEQQTEFVVVFGILAE